jgi:hypothetical protein
MLKIGITQVKMEILVAPESAEPLFDGQRNDPLFRP